MSRNKTPFCPIFHIDSFTRDDTHQAIAEILREGLTDFGGSRIAGIRRRAYLHGGINGTAMIQEMDLGTFHALRHRQEAISGEQNFDELPPEVQKRLEPLFAAFAKDRFNGRAFTSNLPKLMMRADRAFIAIVHYPGFSIIMPDNLFDSLIGGSMAGMIGDPKPSKDSPHDAIFSVHLRKPKSNHEALVLSESLRANWDDVRGAVHGRSGDFFEKHGFTVAEFDEAWANNILTMASAA
jgi:hypothetical protein